MDHLCPEMQAVTTMTDLTQFRQLDDFYANYINRDGPVMLANLTILAIFMKIMTRVTQLELTILTNFCQIHQSRISLVEITILAKFC